MLVLLSLIACLIGLSMSLANIRVSPHSSAQDYYFRVTFSNINVASCGGSITGVYIYANSEWIANDQVENGGLDFGWDYNGIKFSDMLPISLRIQTTVGTVTMWGIVESLNSDANYQASETICNGETASPTTPKPTVGPTAPTTPYPTGPMTCVNKGDVMSGWKSYNNQIYFNNNRFNMKGLSWFGFETPNGNLYGLDKHSMDWYFNWMIERGFNAIRMPFASDFINGNSANLDAYVNAVKAAGDKGLLVMLDMHSKTVGAWTDGLYTINQDQEIETWRKVAAAMVSNNVWNVLFVDVFNEPHDVTNAQWTSWVEFCEAVAEAVWDEGLDALIAIEGTNSDCSVYSCCWGENLEGVRNSGKTFETNTKTNKFVWSPHVYTEDVTGNPTYNNAGYEAHWGYLGDGTHPTNEAAIVIGEFGTKSKNTWLNHLISYLVSIDQKNHFFWCLNPNSGDTGGLLDDDWSTPIGWKLTALATLQPNPSTITSTTTKVCISGLGNSGDGGSSPVSSPVEPPVSSPVTPPVSQPVSSPVASPVASGSGPITITQNNGASQWWQAVNIASGDLSRISKLEYRDSTYTSWVECDEESWGYIIPRSGGPFSGSQHFRVTTSGGRKPNWNVFDGPPCTDVNNCNPYRAPSSATLATKSSFTEEDTIGDSSLTWPGLAAIIVCSLLCILCIGCGVWYYKREGINKGEASFQSTAADTPEPKGNDTPQGTNNEDVAEIEVEMNTQQ